MFKNILVAVDGSAIASRGLKTAVELASDQHAVLHVVHVIDDMAITPTFEGGYIPPDYVDSLINALRENGCKLLPRRISSLGKGP